MGERESYDLVSLENARLNFFKSLIIHIMNCQEKGKIKKHFADLPNHITK